MLNLNICAKCPRGEYSPSRIDGGGRMTKAPGVDCGVTGGHLSSGDEVPGKCSYILEQRLTEDEAWSNMEAVAEEFYGVEALV